ncbi:hypothetical protein FQR65_LT17816 [Abscondita terminalis]|nr:hypothetical protein FQR65_LT17816 [Abscondita terminalis]
MAIKALFVSLITSIIAVGCVAFPDEGYDTRGYGQRFIVIMAMLHAMIQDMTAIMTVSVGNVSVLKLPCPTPKLRAGCLIMDHQCQLGEADGRDGTMPFWRSVGATSGCGAAMEWEVGGTVDQGCGHRARLGRTRLPMVPWPPGRFSTITLPSRWLSVRSWPSHQHVATHPPPGMMILMGRDG